jgi:hypothetical protein
MLGERISEALRRPFELAGEEIFLSVSVGIVGADATHHGGPPSAEALLRDADSAVYRVKERGRGIVELFDESMRTEATERLATLNALHRATNARSSGCSTSPWSTSTPAKRRGSRPLSAGSTPTGGSSARRSSSPSPRRPG